MESITVEFKMMILLAKEKVHLNPTTRMGNQPHHLHLPLFYLLPLPLR